MYSLRMADSSFFNDKHQFWWHLWSCKHCGEGADAKSTETRNKILMAAFEEIYESGFQSASLNDILKKTGTTKGALYHHFKNKIEMGYAIVDEVIYETIRSNWIKPLDETDDPISTLQNILRHSGNLMTEKDIRLGCPLNNLAQEMSPIDEGFRERISNVYMHWRNAIEKACDRGKKAGKLDKNVDSKQLSLVFVATLEGCMGYAKSDQKLETLMSCGQGLIERLESLRP